MLFRSLAEICGEYLAKGKQVYLEGRIQTREWEDRDGNKRYTTEIVANQMQMLGSPPSGGGRQEDHRPSQQSQPRQAAPRQASPRPQQSQGGGRPAPQRKEYNAPAANDFGGDLGGDFNSDPGDYGPPGTDEDIPF